MRFRFEQQDQLPFKLVCYSFLLCLLTFFLGCAADVPLNNLTAGPQRRTVLLNKRLAVFNQALYWGSFDEASAYVAPKARLQFYETMKKRRKSERLVDLEIDSVDFTDNSHTATVELVTRYYQVPNYVVNTRREKQTWEFDRFDGGWFFANIEQMETESESDFGSDFRGSIGQGN